MMTFGPYCMSDSDYDNHVFKFKMADKRHIGKHRCSLSVDSGMTDFREILYEDGNIQKANSRV